jgi:N-acetylmuramoyl-L-alanine amidase
VSEAPITPEFRAKAPQIMHYLMHALPLLKEDAAAILGSFGTETGGFTLREESNGVGYGWAQWSGTRRDDMEEWCLANGYFPYHVDEDLYDQACAAFFIHEVTETWEKRVLYGGGSIEGVFYPPLKDCPDLDSKTLSFWKLYERPGTPHADWREEMAHEALRLYSGSEAMEKPAMVTYERIVISSGHGKYVRGAHGIIDEVDEARKVVEALANQLKLRGVEVIVFHDDVSKSQSENLDRIVDYHNDQDRDLDISVHFNAFEQTHNPRGVEVLYVTQSELAGFISAAIAEAGGFINRGAKYNGGLAFLNGTHEPSVLLEVCFVDSEADCDLYDENFEDIIDAIADVLGGPLTDEVEEGEGEIEITPPPTALPPPRVDIEVSGDVIIFVNGEQIGTKG